MEPIQNHPTIILVHVKPSSKKGPLIEALTDGSLRVFVKEPAVDGKANSSVTALLATHFGVSKGRVSLLKGQKSYLKLFAIS